MVLRPLKYVVATILIINFTSYDTMITQIWLVVAVHIRESIPMVQSWVADAGFRDMDIILLGAHKVFLHSLTA